MLNGIPFLCVFSNEQILSFQVSEVAWKAVPDFSLCNFRDVLSSGQYIERDIVIPAHPRYTRMYGLTNSIAFQAITKLRNLNQYSLLQNMINIQNEL